MKVKHVKKTRMKKTMGEKVFLATIAIFLTFFFLITLYPIIYVVSASFSDPAAVSSGEMLLWPVRPSLDAYKFILKYKEIWSGYGNTIFYTFVGTILNLGVTMPCAYALSRKDLAGRNVIMVIFMITMYIGGGLIPSYLNVNNMGLINTRFYILISGLVSVYNVIVAKTFFANTIPWELQEAAFLDGCSNIKLFIKIIMPLSAPITVVLALYYGVGHWNQYMTPLIYLKDRVKYPLQVILREILTMGNFSSEALSSGGYSAAELEALNSMANVANQMKFAIIVVATVPMLAIYPWLQKYFEKGVMIGSVKG